MSQIFVKIYLSPSDLSCKQTDRKNSRIEPMPQLSRGGGKNFYCRLYVFMFSARCLKNQCS